MVDVVQLVEHRIVVPSVVGSSPIIHPTFYPSPQGRDFCYVPIPITDKNYYLCGYEIMTLKYGKA